MDLQQMLYTMWEADPYKVVISNPVFKAESSFDKLVMNRLETGWQVEKYTRTQVFHENLSVEEAFTFLLEAMQGGFRQCNAWDESKEYTIRISKGGKISCQKKNTIKAPKAKISHDRKKNYILQEGMVIPPLKDMGIFTAEGKVVRSMYDKYKQINRFVELIEDEIDCLPKDRTIHVIDFGCGKSYLTFILYYYLTEVKSMDVYMVGLDLKADVIENCNRAAEKYGYKKLHFELGDICGYEVSCPVDMVISLHACDTATDYALYNAVRWKAKLIFSVPCCQHELNRQMASAEYALMTRYGIVKERMAALLTDAIRGNLLTECGYKTQLLEFVDLSHTPKNILIRAVRTVLPRSVRTKARQEVESVKRQFGFRPKLDELLAGDIREEHIYG